MHAKHPGRADSPYDTHNFIIQDNFLQGYGFYMEGCAMAMYDCGCSGVFSEWNEEENRVEAFFGRGIPAGYEE